MKTEITDALCTFCGCLCDDLRLRKMIDSNHPTDEEVLLKMIKRVKEMSLMK